MGEKQVISGGIKIVSAIKGSTASNASIEGSLSDETVQGDIIQKVPVSGLITIGSRPIRELWFGDRNLFPTVGSDNILYIDTTNSTIYYWNETVYIPITGSGESNITAKTMSEWSSLPPIISKYGHMYIYTDYRQEKGVNIPAIKIGDGNAYVVDLPFFSTGVTELDRRRWNNKVSAMISAYDDENLVLYTD